MRALVLFLGAIMAAAPLRAAPETGENQMRISSPAFENGGQIPAKYSCDGQDASPEIAIEGVPSGAQSLAFIVDDPDAPGGIFVHWVMYNIPPSTTIIPENGSAGTQGVNSGGEQGWNSVCPPSGSHRYFFTLYALDTLIPLGQDSAADKRAVEAAMRGHVLATAELMATYSRP